MTRSAVRPLVAAGAAFGLLGVGLVSSPATAAIACPAGSTQVVAGVCQIVVTESGAVTLPTGVAKITALLVGGGGAGYQFYEGGGAGGGAGEVAYTEDVPMTGGTLDVTIGAGAAFAGGTNYAGPGGNTVIALGGWDAGADGGDSGNWDWIDVEEYLIGGASGNGNAGAMLVIDGHGNSNAGGGGASAAAIGTPGGAGYTSFAQLAAALSMDTTLWPGGAASESGFFTAPLAQGGAGDVGVGPLGIGSGGDTNGSNQSGAGGIVVLRFAAEVTDVSDDDGQQDEQKKDELAATGSDTVALAAASGVLGVLGAGLLLLRRRSRAKA